MPYLVRTRKVTLRKKAIHRGTIQPLLDPGQHDRRLTPTQFFTLLPTHFFGARFDVIQGLDHAQQLFRVLLVGRRLFDLAARMAERIRTSNLVCRT